MVLEFIKEKFKEMIFEYPEKTVCEIVPLETARRYFKDLDSIERSKVEDKSSGEYKLSTFGALWVVAVRDPHEYSKIYILPKKFSTRYPEADLYDAIITHGRLRPISAGSATIVLKDREMHKYSAKANNSLITLGA